MKTKGLKFFFITLLIIWVSHHLSTYLHEWTHGMVAWLAGYKSSPFAIHYGDQWWSLFDIDEAVNYSEIFAANKGYLVSLIAISPTILAVILFFAGLKALSSHSIKKRKLLYYFLFWFTLMNLGQFVCYIPVRTFSKTADIANFVHGLNISPWAVFLPGILFVIWAVRRFLHNNVPGMYEVMNIRSKTAKNFLFLAVLLVLFGFFGAAGFTQPYPQAHFFSWLSWILIPILFFARYRIMSKNS